MNLKMNDWHVLMDEENGGDAGAAGGSIIADAGAESGAEGGSPQDGTVVGNAAGEGEGGQAAAPVGEGEGTGEGAGEGEGTQGGAPESYEAFNIPEGTVASDEVMEVFTSFAKEANLDQATAQKALDYYAQETQKLFDEQEKAWQDVRKGWVDTAKADEEFGGQAFTENMKHVANALQKFGTPGLKDALNQSGLGDNPEMIRFFYRVGKLAGEGEFLTGEGNTPGDKDPASVMYPSMK